MQRNTFHRIVALLIVAVSVGLAGCGGGSAPDPSASTGGAAGKGPPSGTYETRLPDGSVTRIDFRSGGRAGISMTEGTETNSFEGKWVQNGEVFLVEGDEGFTFQFSWRGEELITDFGGITLTFTKT